MCILCKSWNIFSDIMAMARRLDTLHGLCIYTHLHTLTCFKRSQGIFNSLGVFMTSSMSDFYVILHFLQVLSTPQQISSIVYDFLIFSENVYFDRMYQSAMFEM